MPILDNVFKKGNKKKHPEREKRKVKEKQKKQAQTKKPQKKSGAEAQDSKKEQSKATSPIKVEQAHSAYNVIVKPHISEKSVMQNDQRKYVFEVYNNKNKKEVARAIEQLYGVQVEKVNKTKSPAKTKRYIRQESKVFRYDKAVVTLKEGEKLEVLPQ